MSLYKCMIVDDEPVAIRVIEKYLAKLEHYEIVKTSTDAVEAMRWLSSEPVDLLFLDIHMPEITGMELYKLLDPAPEVILITAHRDYAVEGFNIHAVDYLLKPVSFPRFLQALDRFEKKAAVTSHDSVAAHERIGDSRDSGVTRKDRVDVRDYIYVTVERKKRKINLANIVYVESMKDYIQIYTESETVVTKETTTDFEQRLPVESFLRIHRSFIINTAKIDTVTYDEISLGGHTLPVGRSFREKVMESLDIH